MALLLLLYALLILALVGIAIYEHITITTLSLPISPAITILTILLPLLSPLTTLSTPYLLPFPVHNRTRKPTRQTPPRTLTPLRKSLPLLSLTSQTLQLTLTTALLTLLISTLPPSQTTTCLLSNQWTSLWKAHNAPAIRAIQDTLSCCGFRSTRDMAWPFPHKGNPDARGTCEAQFGRHQPCLPEWEGVLRRAVGGEVGVVVCVGVLQVLAVILSMTARGGWVSGGSAGEGSFWEWVGSWGGSRERVERGRRPLLAAAAEEEEEEERDGEDRLERGYREVVDEEDEVDGRGEDADRGEQRRARDGYGAVGGGGPRVEPAHHDPWAGVHTG